MMRKASAPIFAISQNGSGMNPNNGRGLYPPRKSTLAMAEKAMMPAYSDSSSRPNFMPVYSVYAPKMISDSAIGMSKGVRFSSASVATMKMRKPTGWVNTYQ